MSIPLFDFVFLLIETFLGLAKAIIIDANAKSLNAYTIGFNLGKKELFTFKPFYTCYF